MSKPLPAGRSMAPGLLLAGLLAALAGGGCSLFSSSEKSLPPLKSVAGMATISPRWHHEFSENVDHVPLVPAVADGRIYVARSNGEVTALNAATGATVWQVDLRQDLSGGVGAADQQIAVGTRKGDVIVLDDQGRQRWVASSGGGEISAPPVISSEMVVARTGDGKLVGMSLESGKVRWSQSRSLPPLTLYRASSAVAARGALFAGLPGGKLLALTVDQGKVGWEASVAVPRGATELERVADVTGVPMLGERDVCAATYQGRVACIEASSGNLLWSREASSISGLGADAGRVFVADEKGSVSAWERSGGSPAWKNEDMNGRRLIGATAAAGQVVTGDLQGYVDWLSRENGKITARAATDGSSLNVYPMFLGDGVLVQTRKGGLYAFPMP